MSDTKKPPLAMVALAPLVGVYTILMPYAYWRLAGLVWETADSRGTAMCCACFAQIVAFIAFMIWRASP